jgi:hypothetical protein
VRYIRLIYLATLFISLMAGCQQPGGIRNAGTGEIYPVKIKAYGEDLFALDPMHPEPGLDSLLDKYHFFLGNAIDTMSLLQLRDFIMDPLNRQLAEDCRKKYHDAPFLAEELGDLFSSCSKQIAGFRQPEVYTYVSGLLYESPVQYLDSVMIIGLDMFLGFDYPAYRAVGLPVYLTRRMESENILPECARQIASSLIPAQTELKILLDHMILHGKVLYALDVLLPGTADSLKIGYTAGQLGWCMENEEELWRLLIDQELLFSPDPLVIRKFIQDGPFTAGMPEGAPAMLGKWIGWQIVRSYVNKNRDVTLEQLFDATDSQIILSESGYKPKK